jgi:nucleotide-binding universal stress UspA family protein
MRRDDATNVQPEPQLGGAPQAGIVIAPEAGMAPAGSVVVGLSGSVASQAALHWAIRHASLLGRPVHTVAVWHEDIYAPERTIGPEEFKAESIRWLQNAVDELEAHERTADLHTHLDEGDPATILLAEAHDAELLVLGNHRHGALHNAMFGSVALRCMRDATCPVVVVPRPETAGDTT